MNMWYDSILHFQSGQEKLSAMTEEGMLKVTSSQDALIRRQERLKVSQQQAHSFVTHSLHELAREKSLIAAGHRELARMATLITSKLGKFYKPILYSSFLNPVMRRKIYSPSYFIVKIFWI